MMKSVHNQEKLESKEEEEEEGGRHREETTREREREKKLVWVVWFCGRVGTSTEERER
jgi:hypothetical protein